MNRTARRRAGKCAAGCAPARRPGPCGLLYPRRDRPPGRTARGNVWRQTTAILTQYADVGWTHNLRVWVAARVRWLPSTRALRPSFERGSGEPGVGPARLRCLDATSHKRARTTRTSSCHLGALFISHGGLVGAANLSVVVCGVCALGCAATTD